jgi:single-stranded DNA-specific DHH superfamily exonuclease
MSRSGEVKLQGTAGSVERCRRDRISMKKEAEKIDVDAKNIKPSDIGVTFGPVMNAAMFAEYKKRRDGRMNVISAADLQKMMGNQNK